MSRFVGSLLRRRDGRKGKKAAGKKTEDITFPSRVIITSLAVMHSYIHVDWLFSRGGASRTEQTDGGRGDRRRRWKRRRRTLDNASVRVSIALGLPKAPPTSERGERERASGRRKRGPRLADCLRKRVRTYIYRGGKPYTLGKVILYERPLYMHNGSSNSGGGQS